VHSSSICTSISKRVNLSKSILVAFVPGQQYENHQILPSQ
jgi:hypothetical protein